MDDTISRQAAIDSIANARDITPADRIIAVDVLDNLPSAERRERWEHIVRDLILKDGTKIGTVVQTECSVCHGKPLYSEWHNEVESPVCPWCGAKMEGAEE